MTEPVKPPKPPPVTKTINLPYATWKQLKLAAIEQNLTMHQLVQAMLDDAEAAKDAHAWPLARKVASPAGTTGIAASVHDMLGAHDLMGGGDFAAEPTTLRPSSQAPDTTAYDLATGDVPWDLSEDK